MAIKKRRKSITKSRKKTTRKSKAKSTKKTTRKSPRKPFGGYTIKFSGRQDTLEQVFGNAPVTPSQMTKKIWIFIKSRRLANK